MTIQLQKVQYNRRMTIQLQKVQYPYDNTTKSTIQVWQYNCKKYNKYGNTTAKSTIYV